MKKFEFAPLYSQALYRIFDPPLVLKVGQKHPLLDRLLDAYRSRTWAFITAFNPFSQVVSPEENARRNTLLEADLKTYTCFKGQGEDPTGEWEPEASFLVLGIELSHTQTLLTKYGQNAALFGYKDERSFLLWSDTRD